MYEAPIGISKRIDILCKINYNNSNGSGKPFNIDE